VLNNLPTLDKEALFELLSSRFPTTEKKLSHIPNPALLKDSSKAAKKIAEAIKDSKKITLVGDYDVDGVVSSAIMADFFRMIPYPLDVIIPNRFNDGYGVSPKLLQRVDAELIITVDNGITAIEASKICKEKGIELIITDHHTPSNTLPDAYAIVNPKLQDCNYPFKDICGAEVAWLLLGLVKKELNLNINMKQFLDMLCIAIIADIMPLVDINRTLVKEGLNMLMHSNRPASIIIRDFLNKKQISSEDIAFNIAPRINSAGRLKDASLALDFFMAKDTYTAYKSFEYLSSLNEKRKDTEAECTKEAIEMVEATNYDKKGIIVVAKEHWHEGVVGIVASRLVEKFSKPAIVLSINNNIAKGSARSLGDVDIYTIIKENEEFLDKFGGHKMAAGLSLEAHKIDSFRDALNTSASTLDESDFIPKDDVMGILDAQDIDFELLEMLESFEPYGEANPRPKFLIKDSHVVAIRLMGKDKSHSKIEIKQYPHQRTTLELIQFKNVFEMPESKKITCSYTINKNEFNSKTSIQLLVRKIYK
jgi:single-stranded-DNA-specific exonuclease